MMVKRVIDLFLNFLFLMINVIKVKDIGDIFTLLKKYISLYV